MPKKKKKDDEPEKGKDEKPSPKKKAAKKKPKKDYLEEVEGILNKKFPKKDTKRLSSGAASQIKEVIPFGIPAIDNFIIGCGGIPVGRLTELYSDNEGAGKTSLLLGAMAAAQQDESLVVLCETEQAMPPTDRLELFGVDPDQVILIEKTGKDLLTIEDVWERVEAIADGIPKSAPPILFGWDSIAQTPTREEVRLGLAGKKGKDGKVKKSMGTERAKFLSKAIRVIAQKITRSRIAVLATNQSRTKIGVMFGDDRITPGGDAIKFYASLRLRMMGGSAVKKAGLHVAKDITVLAMKNRMAPPFRKCRVRLNYETGWDDDWTCLNLAKDWDLLPEGTAYDKEGCDAARAALEECDWLPPK